MTDIKDLIFKITTFSLGILFFMFLFILFYQIGDEYFLTQLDTTSLAIAPQLGVSPAMAGYIHTLPEDYRSLNIPFDLIFLVFLIMAIVISLYSAMKIQEQGWWSFFGGITIGMMIILLISSYIATIKTWLVLNLFDNFLGVSIQTMPFFYWWVSHMGIFNFVWVLVLIIVNKLNFTYNRDYDIQEQQILNQGEFQK